MVTIVCLCNVLIALVNFYVAWYVWSVRRRLADGTKTLIALEEVARLVLIPAPLSVTKAQLGGLTVKQRYRTLIRLLRQLKPLLSLLGIGYAIWQQQARRKLLNSFLSDRISPWSRFI